MVLGFGSHVCVAGREAGFTSPVDLSPCPEEGVARKRCAKCCANVDANFTAAEGYEDMRLRGMKSSWGVRDVLLVKFNAKRCQEGIFYGG
jgi:hypothetical protein